jgi:hypothetical protein
VKRLVVTLLVTLAAGGARAQEPPPPTEIPPPPTEIPPPPTEIPPPPTEIPPPYQPPAPPAAPPTTTPSTPRGGNVKLASGADLRGMYGIPFYGLHLGLGFGGQGRSLGVYGDINLFLGSSRNGLFTSQFKVGVVFEGIWGRFRFGGGPQLSWFTLRRITRDGNIVDFGIGLVAHFTVDVVRWSGGGRGLYLGIRAGFDWYLFSLGTSGASAPVMVEGGLFVGVRL